MSLVVEFVGLPGSGKSTLSHACGSALREKGIQVDEPSARLAEIRGPRARMIRKARVAFHAGHPIHTIATVLESRQRAPGDVPSLVLSMMLADAFHESAAFHESNALRESDALRESSDCAGVTLLDQGVFQAIWSVSLGARANGRSTLQQWARDALKQPAVVFAIDTPAPEIERRLRARNSGGARLIERGARFSMRDAEAALEITLSVARAMNAEQRISLIHIDGSAPADELCVTTARTITEHIK